VHLLSIPEVDREEDDDNRIVSVASVMASGLLDSGVEEEQGEEDEDEFVDEDKEYDDDGEEELDSEDSDPRIVKKPMHVVSKPLPSMTKPKVMAKLARSLTKMMGVTESDPATCRE
jgi:hypothetical protein